MPQIKSGYQNFGLDHLMRQVVEVQKRSKAITEENIDQLISDGSIGTQKISKVT